MNRTVVAVAGIPAPGTLIFALMPSPRGCNTGDRLLIASASYRVTSGSGQQEEIFMGRGWPVVNSLRHCIQLRPDDIATQTPTILAERKGERQGWPIGLWLQNSAPSRREGLVTEGSIVMLAGLNSCSTRPFGLVA